ncbi:MAG: hypothetical protein ACREQ9_15865 [Candidatus Binatia bacterium]
MDEPKSVTFALDQVSVHRFFEELKHVLFDVSRHRGEQVRRKPVAEKGRMDEHLAAAVADPFGAGGDRRGDLVREAEIAGVIAATT